MNNGFRQKDIDLFEDMYGVRLGTFGKDVHSQIIGFKVNVHHKIKERDRLKRLISNFLLSGGKIKKYNMDGKLVK